MNETWYLWTWENGARAIYTKACQDSGVRCTKVQVAPLDAIVLEPGTREYGEYVLRRDLKAGGDVLTREEREAVEFARSVFTDGVNNTWRDKLASILAALDRIAPRPAWVPKKGERVRGIDGYKVEWVGPYLKPCLGGGYLLGSDEHALWVERVDPLEPLEERG